ncbi:MAG: adenosylmethionine--8-amino-7-oxononanoate transaminase [Helicobacteraceae bacterium]|nr:adenosylmethionine--8-amino-7-oxononanoate transaminase [Helicobacteraceae bacterium]
MTNAQIVEQDLKYIFHPCTQMKDHESQLPLIPIKKAKGVYLYDFDGNRYLDAVSSWWVNLFGHSNSYINEKVKDQLETLEHIIFAGFTHESALNVAKRLVKLTPKGLDKVFFADNGSSAVEIALKMSFQYFKNRGESRPIFVSLENSYHGETMGALAVGDVKLYKEIYDEILIKTIQAKSPSLHSEEEALADMRRVLSENRGRVSSVIIEPLVQCAGSMAMYDATYITALKKLCEEFNVHLIADEIAVGFGRTGSLFACEQAKITPDFLCLSKGITGGYLPLSVTMFSDEVYSAFYCDYNEGKSFLDSHSYTGNALACAAANATLDIFEKDNVIEKNRETIELMSELLKEFNSLKHVKETRQRGMIAAIELDEFPLNKRVNLEIYQYALKNEVLLRPLGNVVYFMPPYTMSKSEIEKMFKVAFDAITNLRY